ncbi:MAG: hypothetical protein ABJB76_02955 [Candidatus Nitrosocosmicus sp.]
MISGISTKDQVAVSSVQSPGDIYYRRDHVYSVQEAEDPSLRLRKQPSHELSSN